MSVTRLLYDLPGAISDFGEIGAAVLKNRLELLSIELKIEKMRLARLNLLVALGAVLVLVAVVLITISVILFTDPVQRPSLMMWFGASYLVLGILVVIGAFKLNSKHKPFEASIEELQKDLESLKP